MERANEIRRLCESDYKFLSIIWKNEPVPSGRLVELCAAELGWKKSTTYTTLKKICEKGLAQNVDTTVTSLVSRQQVQADESRHFVEHTFGGSLPGFLTAFLGGKSLSAGEVDELKALIEQYQEE